MRPEPNSANHSAQSSEHRSCTFSAYTVSSNLGIAKGEQRSDPARDDDGAELGEPLRVERRPALAQLSKQHWETAFGKALLLGNELRASMGTCSLFSVRNSLGHEPGEQPSDPVRDHMTEPKSAVATSEVEAPLSMCLDKSVGALPDQLDHAGTISSAL